ncbi:MAG TPA: CAP domain-containing protein [Polyangiales bacterium]
MREHGKRLSIGLLLLALGACSDGGSRVADDAVPSFDDDGAEDDGANEQETSPSTAQDAGKKRDAGSRVDGGAAPTGDAGRARDGGASGDAAMGGDAATAGDAAASGGDAGSSVAIPPGDHCAPTASWDPSWTAFEDEVLRLTNEARAIGHNCDSEGNFAATTPLTMDPNLRCAARLYAKEMAGNGNFSHTSLDGTTFDKRITQAGFKFTGSLGENIALGQRSPAEVVKGWLDSDGHCANIMSPNFQKIGVGYAVAAGARGMPYWTQEFAGGTPRR